MAVNPLSSGWRVLVPSAATLEGGIWDLGITRGGGKALVGGSVPADGVPVGLNHPLQEHPEPWGSTARAGNEKGKQGEHMEKDGKPWLAMPTHRPGVR